MISFYAFHFPINVYDYASVIFVGDLRSNQLPDHNECGYISSTKIYGGEIAELDEFPWAALLAYKRNGKNSKSIVKVNVKYRINVEIRDLLKISLPRV